VECLCFYLTFQLSDAPVLLAGFLEVIAARFLIFLPHNQPIMAPAQFATQCVAFFKIRISEIELPEIAKIGIRKSLAEFFCQSNRERF
jgi:hypothetical protein